MTVATAVVLVGLLLSACAGRGGAAPTVDVETTAPSPSPTETTVPTATAAPTAGPDVTSPIECWTLPVPDVEIAFTQTPAEFAAINPGLVESGAPSPCSLFATGAVPAAAEQWLDVLIDQGWTPDDRIEDDVYVSRNVTSPSGVVAGYLVSRDETDPAAVTQFLTYTP